jgi:hypothetical protein
MDRREALKSLSVAGSSALFLDGKQATLDAVATSERKLVIFVDENVMPAKVAETLAGKLPIDPVIVPVRVPQGLSIKDLILIGETK